MVSVKQRVLSGLRHRVITSLGGCRSAATLILFVKPDAARSWLTMTDINYVVGYVSYRALCDVVYEGKHIPAGDCITARLD